MMTPHCMIADLDDGQALLIGSLGTTLNMREPQIAAFSVDHRVVAVDLPGHGGTPTPARPHTEPGPRCGRSCRRPHA
jgi:pimeloyl-ACP methyl ester carboxylesterase